MSSPVLDVVPLVGMPWGTLDPFLFCVHHLDAYPEGNGRFGPTSSLEGRTLGQDFAGKDGWNMYHGRAVPGFPQHPHRGFETVTIVRRGRIDHSDSLGARARFGEGDVQWLTAGAGIVHSEMFPLLEEDAPNPVELFQIWMNLPAADKLAEPHFSMLWREQIPEVLAADGRAKIRIIAGAIDDRRAPPPPPRSWAARPEAEVAIWTIDLAPGTRFRLPPASSSEVLRTLYFFDGQRVQVGPHQQADPAALVLAADRSVNVAAGPTPVSMLLLQGRPIDEPIVQHGPFVMNTRAEIQQAMRDYQATGFGGWPFPSDEPVHGPSRARFAERPGSPRERPPG
jgi:hypothetical protein